MLVSSGNIFINTPWNLYRYLALHDPVKLTHKISHHRNEVLPLFRVFSDSCYSSGDSLHNPDTRQSWVWTWSQPVPQPSNLTPLISGPSARNRILQFLPQSAVVLIRMLSAANNRKVNPSGLKQCGNVFAHIGRSPEVKRAPGRMQLGPKLCFLQFCCLCPLLIFSFVVRLAPFAFARGSAAAIGVTCFLSHV